MFRLDPTQLRGMLEELDHARQDHTGWHDDVLQAIACRLPVAAQDVSDDAHRRCRFGQWYYGHPPGRLRDHPAFVAMEAEHTRYHRAAARMLVASAAGRAVAPGDFAAFIGARDQLRLALDSLRHEVEGLLDNRDPLTGAHVRVNLLPELREALELAWRKVQTCCIAFMDLDRFKAINDTYGHLVGDQVLAGAVDFVLEHLRPFDKVYRYGGDEFLISMPGADLEAARAVVERIRSGLARRPVASDGTTEIRVTASFGIAALDPELSVEESIENADRALLAAKAAGRNRACTWDPAATTSATMQPFSPARS